MAEMKVNLNAFHLKWLLLIAKENSEENKWQSSILTFGPRMHSYSDQKVLPSTVMTFLSYQGIEVVPVSLCLKTVLQFSREVGSLSRQ